MSRKTLMTTGLLLRIHQHSGPHTHGRDRQVGDRQLRCRQVGDTDRWEADR